ARPFPALPAPSRPLRPPRAPGSPPFTRSAFVVKKANNAQPNWLRVGLAFGTSAALWALLIKQHHEDVAEYERRKARAHQCRQCS
uniref:NADH dehydrogenase [ubiquinone] 1 subunit C1, mitochondrial n=1 Tax=Zonotrichia albicollis TaxID=44394 RepID=A0A8D2M7G1_ZONAL